MIKLKNITKSFDKIVLNNINLNLEEGNFYIIKGISGSGKTTLFNILTFLDSNYSGDYFWNGKNVKDLSIEEKEEIKKDIAYVFQKSYLFLGLTIRENLLFIKNDSSLIDDLSKKFNIAKLLNKYPEELSGGERQRISLIRALLLDSKVVVLDEPTSSLDKKNAEIFVDYLKKIEKDKIVIIATHKDIYDDLANFIFILDDGNLKKIKNKKNEVSKGKTKNVLNDENNLSTFKYDFLYAIKRKKKRIVMSVLLIILFLLIFTSFSLLINIKREIVTKLSENYPIQVFSLSEYNSQRVDQKINKKYYNYKLEYDDYNAYILLDYNDSVLKNDEILQYGFFPCKDNEVLVNEEFVLNFLNIVDYEKALNTSIIIENEEFIISGIVFSDNLNPYLSNFFYRDIINGNNIIPSIFIPYEKMKTIGYLKSDETNVVISISKTDAIDIYINYDEFTNNNGDFSYTLTWGNEIRNEYSSIYNYVKISLLIGVLMLIFIFIFMLSKIFLELYYKKKEIGYLQLYRISNDRIHLIFLLDYFIEIILALLISIILFNIFCFVLYHIYDFNFYIPLLYWIIFIFILFIYFYFLITIPVMFYLKKDILDCIKEF